MTTTTTPGDDATDEVVAALDDLTQAVEENVEDERLLAGRLRHARHERLAGRSWRSILEAEPDPAMLEVLGRVMGRLSEASGVMRRALAGALRAEGVTTSAVAKMFGVTHQRVSKLLSPRDLVGRDVAAGGDHPETGSELGPR